jgi:hypothetical protein
MKRQTGIVLFVLAAVLIGAGYAACFLPGGPPAWAAWLFALGTATILIAAMMFGALPEQGAAGRRLAVPFILTWLIVFGGFAAALLLDAERATDPLWLGLPRRAAIILYGVGLLPMLVLPIAYALTFDELTLRERDVQRVRDAAARTAARNDTR